ncbi:MAG: hypothetical protein V7638_5406 [Acidobacteriota bacterium]
MRVLPHAPIRRQGCRLTGKPSVSKTDFLSSNLSVPAKFWKGSLTGKAVVPKTTARMSLAGSSPVPSAKFRRRGLIGMEAVAKTVARLRMQVRLLSPPPMSESGPLTLQRVGPVPEIDGSLTPLRWMPVPNNFGPVAQWKQSATLRRSRTYVQIVPGPPISEPVVQLESERSSSKRQAAGSSPAGFTNTGVAQLG